MDSPHVPAISASESPIRPDFTGPYNPYKINLDTGSVCRHYSSLPDIAKVIEKVLMVNNGQLLKDAIAKATWRNDLWVTKVETILETAGGIHTIFRLNCTVIDASGHEQQVALAAMVPRFLGENIPLLNDAEQIMEARKREATAFELQEEGEQYEGIASFPAIYGSSTEHSPNTYYENMTIVIGKWYGNMGGLYVFGELKDKANDRENPDIQRVYTAANMEDAVELYKEVARDIILLQIVIAHRCRRVMAPVFSAADIMVEMNTGRPIISTLRPDSNHQNAYWRHFSELVPGKKEDTIHFITCQLLQLTTSVSQSKENHENLTRYPYFTYDVSDIFYVLRRMQKEKILLSKGDWTKVAKNLKKIRRHYTPAERTMHDTALMFGEKCNRIDELIAVVDALARLE